MLTIQNADAALKDYYLNAVSAQLNDNISPFFSAIEKSTENVFGKNVNMTVVRGVCGNVMAGDEDGALPDPYSNRYITISVPLKNIYGTIELSDKALRASRDSSGAFVNLLNAEMEGLIASAKQNFQRMLFGDGSALLCTISSKLSSYECKVDNVKEFYTGMQVDIYSLSGVLTVSGLYIDYVDMNRSVIAFTTPVTEAIANCQIFVHGSRYKELTGLGTIFDCDDLYGYAKSENYYFQPYIVDANHSLTETALSDVLDFMEENFNSKINMILCSYKTRKMIASLIDANRRVVNTIDSRTGFGAVTVNDVPVYAEKYCPDDRILFVNTDDFSLNQLCDWEWLEDEDGKIIKQVPGKAAYSATLVKYAELICRKPCAQAMLYNFNPATA